VDVGVRVCCGVCGCVGVGVLCRHDGMRWLIHATSMGGLGRRPLREVCESAGSARAFTRCVQVQAVHGHSPRPLRAAHPQAARRAPPI